MTTPVVRVRASPVAMKWVFMTILHGDGRSEAEELSYLPSAGLNRFRFNGSACASQPLMGHPEVRATLTGAPGRCKGETA
jgi:hypothetical protein